MRDASPVFGGRRGDRSVEEAAERASRVLAPRSIAVIGASPREGTLHGRIVPNLVQGGFPGEIFPINPRYEEISGVTCYPSVESIGRPVDLALLVVGAGRVVAALDDCIRGEVAGALIFASGFAEAGETGQQVQAEIEARLDRIVVGGPNFNCIYSQPARAPMGFGPTLEFDVPDAARAIIAQSGAVGTAVVTRAAGKGIGFRYVIATGNEVDLGVEDYLSFLAREEDPVRSCLIFIETIRDVRRFAEAAIECRKRGIRLIAYKVGTSERARAVSSTHTAALAGPIELYNALFEKLGIWSVHSLDQLYLCAQFDWWDDRTAGGLAALSFSGGQAAVLADAAEHDQLPLVELTDETVRRLQQATGAETVNHPFDCSGQVVNDPERWTAALAAMTEQDDVYGLAVALSAVAGGRDAILTDGLTSLAAAGGNVALMWSSGTDPKSTVPSLASRGIPIFERIEDGTACLRIRHEHLARAAASAAELEGYVDSLSSDGPEATLDDLDVTLGQAGLRIPVEVMCDSTEAALAAFAEVGGPVVLKAPRLLHKSDAGGVVTGLTDAAVIREVAQQMSDAHGFPLLLQQQVSGAREVILGFSRTDLGVAVVVGAGGILTELVNESVTMLAPVDPGRVRAALERLTIGRLLGGYRGLAPADPGPIIATAIALGRFALDAVGVESVDLNPVIVSDDGVTFWAVDRKLVVAPAS
jgi:acetate---CoA ligase (ADP-forming)